MDKAEYRIKLDQINELADAGDYKGAVEVVDSVDWRRVKSVQTLCMVGEIYEVNGRPEDCRKMLEIAYKRGSISKTVLYRLAEICIKLGDFDAALDYYTEFAEVSPMDNSKYILKYKLYRARKSPIEDQISILEEYKEREYTERWAYELAKLYSQAGMKDKCVETCDDIILWFSEGKYVAKAMELKMQYAPLSPSQSEKYQNRIKEVLTPPSAKRQETAMTEDTPDEEGESEETSIPAGEAIEKMNAAANLNLQEESTIKIPQTKLPVSEDGQNDPSRMQNQLADSIRAVFAGMNQKGEPVETAQAVAAPDIKVYKPAGEDLSKVEVRDLEPEHFGTEPGHVEAVANAVVDAGETPNEQIEGQMSLADFAGQDSELDLDALIAETSNSLAQEVATGEFIKTDDSFEAKKAEEGRRAAEAARKAQEEQALQAKAAEEAALQAKAAEEAALQAKAAEEAVRKAEEERLRYARETDESLGLTREFNFQNELKKAMETGVVDSAAVAQIIGNTEKTPAEAEIAEAAPQTAAEDTVREAAAAAPATKEAETAPAAEETATAPAIEEAETTPAVKEAEAAAETSETAVEEAEQETGMEKQLELEAAKQPELEAAQALTAQTGESALEAEPEAPVQEQPRRLKYVSAEPRLFDEHEKKIFTYFSTIPGMSQQITQAIGDIHNHAGNKTSKGGNLLLIGRQGSGKTRMCDGMILAVCKDLGIEAAKTAKVIARYFNDKDQAAIVSKLSGGFLIVEGAGELSDEAAEKLSQAMEFRTDSLVVILEDEKADLFAMLDKHPGLAEKFTCSITIPVFTNDELVTFAKTYANEQGYRMDEMGVLALYTMIGDNQKDAEPITVARVKSMVDTAIDRANKGTRKFGRKLSKKAVDEDNRIILYEKDFDFE